MEKEMKTEIVKTLTFAKGGQGAISVKVILPKEWINDMEIDSKTLVSFSYNKENKEILIKKLEK